MINEDVGHIVVLVRPAAETMALWRVSTTNLADVVASARGHCLRDNIDA